MMYLFSFDMITSIFKNIETKNQNIYEQFFHSNMNLDQMLEMDTSFKIVMMLLHFNPINLMLKYSIIKFDSFTSIIIETKNQIHDKTHKKFSFKSDMIHSSRSDLTNERNVKRVKEFEAGLQL